MKVEDWREFFRKLPCPERDKAMKALKQLEREARDWFKAAQQNLPIEKEL